LGKKVRKIESPEELQTSAFLSISSVRNTKQ